MGCSRLRACAKGKQAYAVVMKRLAVAAMLVAGILAMPVCAQRGGGHGGFSGHASGGFHGGGGFHSGPSGGMRGGAGHGGPVRSGGFGVRARVPMQSYRGAVAGSTLARAGNPDHRGHRQPYHSPYHTRYPYLLAPYYGYVGAGYLGDPDESDSSDGSSAAAENGGGYDAQPPEPDEEAFRPPYGVMPAPSAPPAPQAEEAVTLVFKDGRPSEQVRNYILTRTTLYVQDGQQRAIPVEQLDLLATAKVNQDAGVSFQLPNGAR